MIWEVEEKESGVYAEIEQLDSAWNSKNMKKASYRERLGHLVVIAVLCGIERW